jgi:hypothetical protein
MVARTRYEFNDYRSFSSRGSVGVTEVLALPTFYKVRATFRQGDRGPDRQVHGGRDGALGVTLALLPTISRRLVISSERLA